ncbi:MAG: ATP-binding protein, partial [Thermomicrobiales bacterium]
ERAWAAPGAELITVWGRRRVGKSALLSRFAAGKHAIYIYGTRISQRDLLSNMATQMARVFDMPSLRFAAFQSWDDVFDILTQESRKARLLVVFDEFPYLCDVSQGLDTLVQRWWDRIHRTENMMVVIAGSAFSAMRGLTGYTGALHGRRTGQMDVEPFGYFDAAHFFAHLSPVDRVRAYACFGGIPAYLNYVRDDWTLAENVQQTILTPGHVLYREAEDLLRIEFHQEMLYASILRSIASGEERPSDIARDVGKGGVNEILEHLVRLQELHFIRRDVPVTEFERPRSRRVLYRVADPYLRFWFRYVTRYQAILQVGDIAAVWERDIEPTLDEFVARTTWEDVCIQYLWNLLAARRIEPTFQRLGRWWDNQNEIDIVGTRDNHVTLAGECKWTNAPVGMDVFHRLQTKTIGLEVREPVQWVLASRAGFEPEVRRRAEQGDLLLIEPDDLFAPELERPV